MLNKIFDGNGNARYTCVVKVASFDPTNGLFTGVLSIRIIKGTGIPGNCTFILPDTPLKEHETYLFNKDHWVIIPDYRGLPVKELATGKMFTVGVVGAIPDGYELQLDN